MRAFLCWIAELTCFWVPADLQPSAFLLSKVTEYVAQILSEFGIDGYTSGVAAEVQAFADFRATVREHAKSGLASSSEPRAALKSILQAADRYPLPDQCP